MNEITVTMPDGKPYVIRRLTAHGDKNAKLSKSNKSGKGYLTVGMSLSPSDSSGLNVCPSASPGCRASCLFFQGRGRMGRVANGRIARTLAWFQQRGKFLAKLRSELHAWRERTDKVGQRLAVRLNVLSDIPWEQYIDMETEFSDVQFYDYTKTAKRMVKSRLPRNYHLTFSRSETNETDALKVLESGMNVAVVFGGPLPDTWNGFRVVDGDETDLRFLDGDNVVVGLKAKGTAKHDKSGFVVNHRLVVL